MMLKIKDAKLFRSLKDFLTVYSPVVRRKSDNTIRSYINALNIYFDFLLDTKKTSMRDATIADFNQANLLAFMGWLQEMRGNEISSVNQRLAHIRTFCRYLMKKDLLLQDELNRIEDISLLPDKRKEDFVFLSIEDMKLILKQPNINKKTGLRDKFYMALLYDSGCRDQELLDLKLKDFDESGSKGAELHIVGKGNKYRVTPISSEVVHLFHEYCKVYHFDRYSPDAYIFYTKRRKEIKPMSDDNVQRFLRTYEKMAKACNPNLPHLHAHLFRRSRAMHLYMAGVPLPLIAEWLGHSNLETVQVYARATIDMKRKAAEKLAASEKSVFKDDVAFKYADDDDALKRLCGLA